MLFREASVQSQTEEQVNKEMFPELTVRWDTAKVSLPEPSFDVYIRDEPDRSGSKVYSALGPTRRGNPSHQEEAGGGV